MEVPLAGAEEQEKMRKAAGCRVEFQIQGELTELRSEVNFEGAVTKHNL